MTTKREHLICPIDKTRCIGVVCFKWYSCLRSRYDDFYYMLTGWDEMGDRCPPDHFRVIMGRRITRGMEDETEVINRMGRDDL
jgi:hypothetical protein